MKVRTKFRVDSVKEAGDGMKAVSLNAVIGGSPENDSFFKWTPSGQISIGTINKQAAENFNVGQEFYVDFTPVA